MNSSEIAERVNLSVSAVIERIKKLESGGVIKKYTVILDNAALGKDVSAMMFVSMENPKFNTGFENMVKAHTQITDAIISRGLRLSSQDSHDQHQRARKGLERHQGCGGSVQNKDDDNTIRHQAGVHNSARNDN
jgi:DNA-binding Lrp family transcriptional regulator